jgi:peptidoglycan/xylan/chitin deacetylase (PgdA/CDA1 family)
MAPRGRLLDEEVMSRRDAILARRYALAALAITGLAVGARAARANSWPTPAAGEAPGNDVEVLFTFDDGPNPTHTPLVLDILAKHRIQAVFFLVGEMAGSEHKKVPAIIERILREGHVIANHTLSHQDLCRVPAERAIRELDEGKAVIERVAGMQVQWFRAPYGVRCDRLDQLLAERRIEHFHWDLDPQEWRHNNVDKTVKYITGELSRAHGRNVLLLHDIKAVTVKALPQVLAWIDAENAKRQKSRKRKIKILQAPALAIERLPPGFVAWAAEATADLRALPRHVASVLP